MSVEDRLLKLEEFAADVREHTRILTEIVRRYDERLDEHEGMFREANSSIAALADAQIRTEETVRTLGARVDNLTAVVERLVDERRNGQP
jgi:ATP-dependent protease HslVU (ClpYQ) ATPase subunit